jgi:hypothetical protein
MRGKIFILLILISQIVIGQVHVNGYYRSNGTYVEPYTRSSPNSNPYDNYSYPGNTNPYTGKTATGDPDIYIKNLYNRNNPPSSSDVWVNGYYRDDGTYVKGYWRSAPNGNPSDNYTSRKNSNSYSENTSLYNSNPYYFSHTFYVNSKILNVRSGPSTNYPVLTKLSFSESVEILEDENLKWSKISVTYYNGYTLKSSIGYVYKGYLSTEYPSFSETDYSSKGNYTERQDYSLNLVDIVKSLPENYFSNLSNNNTSTTTNKGSLSLWTDCYGAGQISVYIDGNYQGTITSYFHKNEMPDCGYDGTLVITLNEGTHSIIASGSKRMWQKYVTITADKCALIQLPNK